MYRLGNLVQTLYRQAWFPCRMSLRCLALHPLRQQYDPLKSIREQDKAASKISMITVEFLCLSLTDDNIFQVSSNEFNFVLYLCQLLTIISAIESDLDDCSEQKVFMYSM